MRPKPPSRQHLVTESLGKTFPATFLFHRLLKERNREAPTKCLSTFQKATTSRNTEPLSFVLLFFRQYSFTVTFTICWPGMFYSSVAMVQIFFSSLSPFSKYCDSVAQQAKAKPRRAVTSVEIASASHQDLISIPDEQTHTCVFITGLF